VAALIVEAVEAVVLTEYGDAEQDEVVLRVDDRGQTVERGGLQVGAMDSEAGDPRRSDRPEAIGGSAVQATAEVAVSVEEDRLRRRRILGVGKRRDREERNDGRASHDFFNHF
jgi:hypothetical protein